MKKFKVVVILVIVVSIILVAVTGPYIMPPAMHYRIFGDGESLFIVLSDSIRPGDAIDNV